MLAGAEKALSGWAVMNPTHDSHLKSWVAAANEPGADFPIQNLPFGVFRRAGDRQQPTIGVAIGDQILDLNACAEVGRISPEFRQAASAASLNSLMAMEPAALSALRQQLSGLLRTGSEPVESLLAPMRGAVMQMPAGIGDYTDFYASIFHATNVGKLFRPDDPLLPNYKYVPVGYHGRASSIVISGHAVRRPHGQRKDAHAEAPTFGPSRSLDYEVEVGFFVGRGNSLGEPIPIATAASHVFGACLVNDWSARDIQAWEYQPLGPFLGKSLATAISPWVVTMEALEPFRVPAFARAAGDPDPLPYLDSPEERGHGGIDIRLEVYLAPVAMRAAGMPPLRLSRGTARNLYWTIGQMLAHHASNGCNLRTGDLLASGTVSGPEPDERGCLLELTRRGAEPIRLTDGTVRKFLEDGDEVIIRGYCERPGFVRIGFGECRGVVEAAL
jgi:fumarylacetoacetase